jgi:hypothetical protein
MKYPIALLDREDAELVMSNADSSKAFPLCILMLHSMESGIKFQPSDEDPSRGARKAIIA